MGMMDTRVKKYSWLLLLLIPLIITINIRLQPMRLVPLENAAESNVMNFYRSQIADEVNRQYPDLPDAQRSSLADSKFNEFVAANRANIDSQVMQTAESMKSRVQYESGSKKYVYLGDIDSYYWLRFARSIVERGTECDLTIDGKCYDAYTTAPNPIPLPKYYYSTAIVVVYGIIRIFNPDLSLMQASFLTPLAFSLLLTIPLFLLLRRIGGNTAAVIGTVLVNVNSHVLSRSLGSDNDIVNVFFQAVFIWLAIECFYAKTQKKKFIWAFFAGVSIFVYSKFWIGWWYLADLFVISLVFRVLFIFLHNWYKQRKFNIAELRKPLKETALVILVFLIPVILFFGVFFGSPSSLWGLIISQVDVLKFKVASNVNLWPNVLTTVAEFNGVSIGTIIASFGSFLKIPLFLMAILGSIFLVFPNTRFIRKNLTLFFALVVFDLVLYSLLKSSQKSGLIFLLLVPIMVGLYAHMRVKEEAEFHPDMVFLLATIICLVVYFSMTGARFLFLMAIPVSIFIAIFCSRVINLLVVTVRKSFGLPRIVAYLGIAVLVCWFLVSPVRAGKSTAQSYLPYVTDEWVAALEKIRYESKPDAIINSWWDFGHWFKYYADRRVTLDGSSQNNPQLHWLGKLLLTSNESLSRGILRMLDCGGNNAFEKINEKINDAPHSIDILNSIIVERKPRAIEILSGHGFLPSEIDDVLKYSHCSPPEDFLITSQDMIGKSGVWAHFGSWNFKKSYLNSVIGQMPEKDIIRKFREDYDMSENEIRQWISELSSVSQQDQINAWIAPWPGYMSGLMPCTGQDTTYLCQFAQGNNRFPVTVDLENREAYVLQSDGTRIYPNAVSFTIDSSFSMKDYGDGQLGLGMAVMKSGDSVSAAFMSPELAGSIFTRLFFLEGVGITSFERFHDITTMFGDRIITWKVVWDNEDQ
ncbi:hypothetical protein JXA85_05595 [Candidatus Woesearchaeota archaeon]|nr:hypothetical protein [Candidatus Woesearchaeota archaeon]